MFRTITITITSLILSLCASIANAQDCCGGGDMTPVAKKVEKKDIVDTAVAAGSFKTLVTAVTTAELGAVLKGKGPFTVFAPTDAAFGKLPKGTVHSLLQDAMRGKLTSILTWHVVPGRFTASQVVSAGFLPTVNGQRLQVNVTEGAVMVGGARVTATDIECSNGIIHVLGDVMMPASKNIVATAAGAGTFKTLLAAATQAGLAPALSGKGPFTVLAPSDAAFAKLPAGTVESLLKPENKAQLAAILKYHVVSGRTYSDGVVKARNLATLNGQRVPVKVSGKSVAIGGAHVTAVDIECSNGVIHVIGDVMLPASNNIVATAKGAGIFNTLLAAATAAGLAPVLSEGGPFTVLAPTDAAFAKLPAGTVQSLLKPANKHKLVSILKYHVISGRAYSDAVVKMSHAKTIGGGTLKISLKHGKAFVNEAQIVKTDIDASNGVIHVIDSVLLPN